MCWLTGSRLIQETMSSSAFASVCLRLPLRPKRRRLVPLSFHPFTHFSCWEGLSWLCDTARMNNNPPKAEHTFLFASLDSKPPSTARKVHIRRLYDIFQVTLQRGQIDKARRAWAILSRCKEIDWRKMWTTGLLLLKSEGDRRVEGDMNTEREDNGVKQEQLEFLRAMMLQNPGEARKLCSPFAQ